jgi:hypothetical protein
MLFKNTKQNFFPARIHMITDAVKNERNLKKQITMDLVSKHNIEQDACRTLLFSFVFPKTPYVQD